MCELKHQEQAFNLQQQQSQQRRQRQPGASSHAAAPAVVQQRQQQHEPQYQQQPWQQQQEGWDAVMAPEGRPLTWRQRAVRAVAGGLLFLGASAAGPLAPRAHAAALQPPPSAAVAQQSSRGAASQAAPSQLATTSALPSSSSQQPQQQPGGGGGGGAPSQQQQQQGGQQAGAAGGDAVAAEDLLPSELRVISIFESNRPSVVNVSHVRSMQHFHTLDLNRMAVGQGTGFVWDRAGHIVVAAHTVRGASEVKVTLHDQTTATARVVGADAPSDIAVLQLALPRTRTEVLRPLTIGSSSNLRIGQSVWAIGNPWGLEHTLSQGIVSGLGREMGAGLWALKGTIQTDAAVNAGNSGGPLLDSKGRVVGVAIALPETGARGAGGGVGHAVPIDSVRRIVEQLLAHGRVKRPSMGVVLAPQQVLSSLGVEGVLVLEVPAGSPAAAAGLRATHRDVFGDVVLGDVIVGIDTRPVRSASELLAALDDKRPGDRVRCDVLRDGKRLSMTVLLGERTPGAVEE